MKPVKFAAFTYASGEIPEGYACSTCGATRCKLWREYQTMMTYQRLYCGPCAIKDTQVNGQPPITIRPDGKASWFLTGDTNPLWVDSIGRLVPAVPLEDGTSMWGYTSVPDDAVAWWRNLPSYPEAKP